MNQRERVLAALCHTEPDRVPLDFGGTGDTTVNPVGYVELRRQLGLRPTTTFVLDVYQQTALVEEDLRQTLDVDVMPVFNEPMRWRDGFLEDGSPAKFPAKFQPLLLEDGSQVVLNEAGNIVVKMPQGGHYFDPIYSPLAQATSTREIEECVEAIENYDTHPHLDKSYEEIAEKARELRDGTDYLLIGFFGGHILQACQSLRGWETFLTDLLVNEHFAHALLERVLEANLKRFEKYAATVGQYVQVTHFEDDLGTQDRPLLSPSLYRRMIKPYHLKLFRFAKSRCASHILFHSDGAIAPLIPDFIDMGVDAVNPVQVSAAGMDTKWLKKEFGREIAFWGGGCDSQAILPFGTPKAVEDEVKRRIDDLAPGGGFVFSSIHNVQAGVPAGNVAAMFRTAREYGVY